MSRIFISYSRSDKSVVDELIRRLEAAGHEVWLDRGGIRGGEQWRQEIVEAIEGNDAFLLILSENSTESDHVRAELDVAKESKKRIIPIDIQQVEIPSSMKYQLAGQQRIKMHADYEYGFQELLLTLGEGQMTETTPAIPRPAPSSGGHQRTRTIIALISGIFALVILFSWVGYRVITSTPDVEEESQPTLTMQTVPESVSPTEALVALPTAPVSELAALDSLTTVEEIEPLLLQANIRLSEPVDEERMRSYFTGPDSAYHMLAVASLKVVGERRFKQYVNLDIVDKWYTQAMGSGYADRGQLDLEIVKESLIDAHNDYWSDNAASLDGLLEPLK